MVRPRFSLRDYIGGIAFRVYLWSQKLTLDEYWEEAKIEVKLWDDVRKALKVETQETVG